jgi:hypothetical protein
VQIHLGDRRRSIAVDVNQMDPATLKVFYSCLVVLIVLAVIPWRYVVAQYVTKPGDRWR